MSANRQPPVLDPAVYGVASPQEHAEEPPLLDPLLHGVDDDDDAPTPALFRLLSQALQQGASDLHIHAGAPLQIRALGRLQPLQNAPVLTPEATATLLAEVLDAAQQVALREQGQVDGALDVPHVGRVRLNAYRQQRGTDVVLRIVPPQPPTLQSLGLPETLQSLLDHRVGMVLCTGPTGCGKSTTLAAILHGLIQARRDHVITIEDPIEFVYPPGRCWVNQRQVHAHTQSFSRALRAALREDPDIIAITELRDRETIALAMSAAETGHLVLGTLHTGNAAQTIHRIINAFPAEEQPQIRAMLSESLRAVVSQRLVPRAEGRGRVAAVETLMVTPAVANLIREDKVFQIATVMQTGRAHGMRLLDESLRTLVAAGTIRKQDAIRYATNKTEFQ